MVADIAGHNTTQWDVMDWATRQGQYMPSPGHQAVLFYLAANAFYEADNPEHGEIGQVLRQRSYTETILAGTGIKSRSTLRKVLNALQDMAYIQREEREDARFYGQQPHRIYVLWDEDELRAQMRAGKKTLPMALRNRPSAPPRKDKPLAEVLDFPLSSNS